MYVVIAGVLVSAIFSDVSGLYKALLSAFHPVLAFSMALALVLAFEMSLAVGCLGFRNLFAFGKMAIQSWLFYLALTVFSIIGAFHLGQLFMDNLHAVGVTQRAFTNAVKYDDDPMLRAARSRVTQISQMLEQTEKTIASIAVPMRQAGFAASGFSLRAGDTTLSVNARRDQLWNANRANKSQSNLGVALMDASKEKSRLLTAKLFAQDRLDSLMSALDIRYRHKSPEDFAEASIGRNLLADISSATVWASLLAIAALVMVRAYQSGVIEYRMLEYKPAGLAPISAASGEQTSRDVESSGSGMVAIPVPANPTGPDVILPQKETYESSDSYQKRVGELFIEGFFEKVTQKLVAKKMGITEVDMTRLLKKVRGQRESLKENKNGKSTLKEISV